jgi:hypothetical protein
MAIGFALRMIEASQARACWTNEWGVMATTLLGHMLSTYFFNQISSIQE